MKALSLWQPWADALAGGVKTIETRSWSTLHRGLLAVHAAARKTDPHDVLRVLQNVSAISEFRKRFADDDGNLAHGAMIGVVEVVDVVPMLWGTRDGDVWRDDGRVRFRLDGVEREPTEDERRWGDWGVGRFAWITRPVVSFDVPCPVTGRQRLFDWTPPFAYAEQITAARGRETL